MNDADEQFEDRHDGLLVAGAALAGAVALAVRKAKRDARDNLPRRITHTNLVPALNVVRPVLGDLSQRIDRVVSNRVPGIIDRAVKPFADLLDPTPLLFLGRRLLDQVSNWFRRLLDFGRQVLNKVSQSVFGTEDTTPLDVFAPFDQMEQQAGNVGRDAVVHIGTQTVWGMVDMPGVVGYKVMSQSDNRVRPKHWARHGREYYRDPTGDQLSYEFLPRPPFESPFENFRRAFNCILPGNVVQGRVEAVSKATYSGEAVEIQSADGARLTVTAQHPVLTDKGFTAAGLLKKGDNLVRYRPDGNKSVNVDVDHPPVKIDQLFEAFSQGQSVDSGGGLSGLDFYGDAKFFKSDVHVAKADVELLNSRETHRLQSARNQALVRVDVEPLVQSGFCSRCSGRSRLFSSLAQVKSLIPLHLLGLGLIPNFDAQPFQHPVQAEQPAFRSHATASHSEFGRQFVQGITGCVPSHNFLDGLGSELQFQSSAFARVGDGSELDTRLGKPTPYGVALHPEFPTEMRERNPGLVTTDQIREIRRFHFDGPVYDLQTPTGYFTAGSELSNIVVANCRCYLIPIFDREFLRV